MGRFALCGQDDQECVSPSCGKAELLDHPVFKDGPGPQAGHRTHTGLRTRTRSSGIKGPFFYSSTPATRSATALRDPSQDVRVALALMFVFSSAARRTRRLAVRACVAGGHERGRTGRRPTIRDWSGAAMQAQRADAAPVRGTERKADPLAKGQCVQSGVPSLPHWLHPEACSILPRIAAGWNESRISPLRHHSVATLFLKCALSSCGRTRTAYDVLHRLTARLEARRAQMYASTSSLYKYIRQEAVKIA